MWCGMLRRLLCGVCLVSRVLQCYRTSQLLLHKHQGSTCSAKKQSAHKDWGSLDMLVPRIVATMCGMGANSRWNLETLKRIPNIQNKHPNILPIHTLLCPARASPTQDTCKPSMLHGTLG